MKSNITFAQAVDGYFIDARSRQLSAKTIADYANSFRHFQNYIGPDTMLASITPDDIRRFFIDLSSVIISPAGVAPRPDRKLCNKSLLNIHIGLSALWTWAIKEGFVDEHVVRAVKAPKPKQKAIETFSRDDIIAMLTACEHTEAYTRPGKSECSNTRPTAARDRAIILLLLDTGIRAAELATDPRHDTPGLRIQDLDQRNCHIKVMGKGNKERIIPISHRTLKAIWRYLATDRPDAEPKDPLFTSSKGGPFTVSGLGQLIRRLGYRAGVINAHPHKFRHTFATNFLRNGGKTLELKHFLGHSTLEMVERYVALAQVDLEDAHRHASPVTNWNL